MQKPAILITGGAGYIGSHIIQQLAATNERIIVLDDLSTGFADSIPNTQLIIGNCGNIDLITKMIHDYQIESVIHLAACTIVPESIQNPVKYYQNNTVNTLNLIRTCAANNIKHFIFSSSAAVYGIPAQALVSENDICNPINPYGHSKLMSEWILQDICKNTNMHYVALRYFNVGGADPQGRCGQRNSKNTTLIHAAVQTALGIRPFIEVFGTDYPTPDGTGIRDYIHVTDLANAHLSALNYLRQNKPSVILNCGYGHGYSVRQVLDTVECLAHVKLTIRETAKRPGDPAEVIADTNKIQHTLAWQAQYNNLDVIIETSLNWERKLLDQRRL